MSDSRMPKIRADWPDDDVDAVPFVVGVIESAGIIVADPADPAVIDRVRDALVVYQRHDLADQVRAVLAALSQDGSTVLLSAEAQPTLGGDQR